MKIPKTYSETDIFPTLARVAKSNGKFELKTTKQKHHLVFIKYPIPKRSLGYFRKKIDELPENKVSKGKIALDENFSENLNRSFYCLTGTIFVRDLEHIGTVVNPFSNRMYKLWRQFFLETPKPEKKKGTFDFLNGGSNE